jgi:hypothetical protein
MIASIALRSKASGDITGWLADVAYHFTTDRARRTIFATTEEVERIVAELSVRLPDWVEPVLKIEAAMDGAK